MSCLVLFLKRCGDSAIDAVIEIRGSGFKLCHGYQRPPWKARDSIGSWYTVRHFP